MKSCCILGEVAPSTCALLLRYYIRSSCWGWRQVLPPWSGRTGPKCPAVVAHRTWSERKQPLPKVSALRVQMQSGRLCMRFCILPKCLHPSGQCLVQEQICGGSARSVLCFSPSLQVEQCAPTRCYRNVMCSCWGDAASRASIWSPTTFAC